MNGVLEIRNYAITESILFTVYLSNLRFEIFLYILVIFVLLMKNASFRAYLYLVSKFRMKLFFVKQLK